MNYHRNNPQVYTAAQGTNTNANVSNEERLIVLERELSSKKARAEM